MMFLTSERRRRDGKRAILQERQTNDKSCFRDELTFYLTRPLTGKSTMWKEWS